MTYIATNISIGYLSIFMSCEKETELETLLTGLGKLLNDHFFCAGCKIIKSEKGSNILLCRESLPMLKKAKLKVKSANK